MDRQKRLRNVTIISWINMLVVIGLVWDMNRSGDHPGDFILLVACTVLALYLLWRVYRLVREG